MTEYIVSDDSTFFLDTDDDGHWYVIPGHRRGEWEVYLETYNEYGEAAFELPSFADPIGGAPNNIEFQSYINHLA